MTASMTPRPVDDGPGTLYSSHEMIAELEQLVERGRARWRRLILAEAASLAIATPLAYLWGVFLVDNVIHLPTWALLLANAAFLLCVVWAGRRLLRSWRRARFTTDQVALAIERRTAGGVENRLINALQLARGAAVGQRATTEAAVSENYRFLKQVQLQQSAESRPVILRASVALLLIVVGLGFWAVSAERFTTSAGRLFMPLAGIEPIYRTRLTVEPGNVTVRAGQAVTVRISVAGSVPEQVQLLVDDGDRQSLHPLPVDPDTATASHTFPAVRQSMTYSLRGGDFRTPRYTIQVPTALQLQKLQASLTYPDYTDLETRQIESTSGDLEAPIGTDATLEFTLNQPLKEAWLRFDHEAVGDAGRLTLSRAAPDRYTTAYTFDRSADYTFEARRADGERVRTRPGRLHAAADELPNVQLTGLEDDSEVMLDNVLNLSIRASDDFGLGQVALVWRPLGRAQDATSAGADASDWRAIQKWDASDTARDESFQQDAPLLLNTLAIAEGDRIEIAARANDRDPDKAGQWRTSTTYTLTATSPGASLQLTYQRLLRTERRIEELIESHAALERTATKWFNHLSPDSPRRWDAQQNIDELAATMKQLASDQAQARANAGATARRMPPEAGENLAHGLGMLADTEMVRHIRLLERVVEQDTRQSMRSTLADARLTVQRTIRSLRDMRQRYVAIREDWELNHMVSFTEMLAERQARLAEASRSYLDLAEDALSAQQHSSIARRQALVHELSGLAQTAFEGMARREAEVGPILARAFDAAADAYADSGLLAEMRQAGTHLEQGAWSEAAPLQQAAADKLTDIYNTLREAKADVARDVLARLEKLTPSTVEAQQAIEALREGFREQTTAMQDELNVADTVRAMEVVQNFEAEEEEEAGSDDRGWMDYTDQLDELEEPENLVADTTKHTLADTFMELKPVKEDRTEGGRNPGETVAQDHLEDVIGELMEGVDELKDDYTTFRTTASKTVMDTNTDVGRGGGEPISSTGATATTGNQPPPPEDVGGASRIGRLGGRSHGITVGDHFTNRRGNDEAFEGSAEVPEQDTEPVAETVSDDPQEEASTGRGGRRIDDDETHFSTRDTGEWNDQTVDEMEDAQQMHQIVERAGDPADPAVMERLRDTEDRQKQVIERIKTVKKDLDELFLPTDHLDDIMGQLEGNLDRLREAPEESVFREQLELLDRLQASVIVFNRPSSEFVQSVPRQPRLKGAILDERAPLPLPDYAEAVERYYRGLVNLEAAR